MLSGGRRRRRWRRLWIPLAVLVAIAGLVVLGVELFEGGVSLAQVVCSQGEAVEYRPFPGVNHLEIGPRAASFVAGWIADRFAGTRAPSTCRH